MSLSTYRMHMLIKIVFFLGLIIILHKLYNYMKSSFSTPKKINLVDLHREKYQEIVDELRRNNSTTLTVYAPPKNELSKEDKEYLQQSLLQILPDA